MHYMKLKKVSLGGLILILGLAGCSTIAVTDITPSTEIYVESARPLKVDGEKLDTVSFTKVLIQIPPGDQFGRIVMNGSTRQEIPFDGDGVSEASVNYNILAMDELRSLGYNVMGGESLLFAQDESAKARYAIGGSIRKLLFIVYGSFWSGIRTDAPLEMGMDVEWQIYDTRNKRVCYTVTTRGYSKQEGAFSKVMQDTFREAFRTLLSKQAFSDAIRLSKSSVEKENWEELKINSADEEELSLPADLSKTETRVFTVKAGGSHGTGFFVSSDGYALTAAHVVSGLTKVTVLLSSGITLEADVIRASHSADTALLKIQGSGFPSFTLGKSPSVGTDVFVIGSPLSEDYAQSVSKGVVSGIRHIDEKEYIQTDAAVNFGNSGGPLIDESGNVLGVINQKVAGIGVEGLGFAIPIENVTDSLSLNFETR